MLSDEAFGYLAALLAGESWKRDALCVEHPEVEFFIDPGERSAPAKSICRACLVHDECRDYAVALGIGHGIWGGTTGRERRGAAR